MTLHSLWDCFNSKVTEDGKRIYCSKGYRFPRCAKDGSISINTMIRDEPMEYKICQVCPAWDYMDKGVSDES